MSERRQATDSAHADRRGFPTNGETLAAPDATLGGPGFRDELLTVVTPLIGREGMLAELERLLRDPATRHLTLTGVGGSGKTRVALQVAENTSDSFPGGVVVVALASLAHSSSVIPAVARALGLREVGGDLLGERIAAALGDERTLIVLDNFEHVIDAAPFVSWLLQACPRLVVLITSRMRLRTQGEREYQVPPLATAPLGDGHVLAAPSEAALLFADRMCALGIAEDVDEHDRVAIEEICRRLDGLPLAVELAAAWSKVLRPAALLARLEPALPMLVGGNRDAPERQRTVRAAIQWSYDRLTSEEQELFRTLGVFRGGCALDSIEAIAGGDQPARLLETVAGLVEKSLLIPIVSHGHEPRFMMLETLREFAAEQLEAAGKWPEYRERHGRHFAEIAERIGPLLQWQPDPQGSIARLDADQDNIQSAVEWAAEHDPLDAFLRLVSALQTYWMLRGRLLEGTRWLERALTISEAAPLPLRAQIVRACAWNCRFLGDYQRTNELGQIALELATEAGDHLGVMHSMTMLGFSAQENGDYLQATTLFEDVLALAQDVGDLSWIAWTTRNIGRAAHQQGDFATARTHIERAIAIFDEAGYAFGLAEAQDGLALLALELGDYWEAACCWRNRMSQEWDAYGLAFALEGLGEVALGLRWWEAAVHLLGAAEKHRARMAIPVEPSMRARYDRILEMARSSIDRQAFETAWETGRRCSASEARALGFAFADDVARADRPLSELGLNQFGLTRREIEVLELVAAQRTNRQIADALFISLPTVKRHLTTVFGKLGVDSRGDAVAAYSKSAHR